MLVCLTNDKIYIGKANNLKTRMYMHVHNLKYIKDSKTPLKNAMLKYGPEQFLCYILEEAPIDRLIELETKYIDMYRSHLKNVGYNVLRYGFERTGTKHSQATIEKIKVSCKKNVKRGEDHYTIKDGNISNIKKAHQRNLGKHRSDEVRARISKAQKGKIIENKRKKIKQICITTGNVLNIFDAVFLANLAMGKREDNGGISKVLNKGKNTQGFVQKTAHGFRWEFVE